MKVKLFLVNIYFCISITCTQYRRTFNVLYVAIVLSIICYAANTNNSEIRIFIVETLSLTYILNHSRYGIVN